MNDIMNCIGKDIIEFKINDNMTVKEIKESFYNIVRKYNIKYGTKIENGVQGANFDWTMCFELFLTKIRTSFEMDITIFDELPKDILY